MTESPSSDPWGHNPPTSDGTWQAPPPPVAPYQSGAPYQNGAPYEPSAPFEPNSPYQLPGSYQPPAPYQPPPADQPAAAYQQTQGQPYQQQQYPPTQPYQQDQPYQQAQPGQPFPPGSPYPPQAAYPPIPPWQVPPKKRNVRLIVRLSAAGLVLLIVAIGALASTLSHHHKSAASSKSISKAGPTIAAIPLGDGAELKKHLAALPKGAKTIKIDNSTGGVQTLDQYMANSFPDSPSERGFLVTRGFEVAAENDWTGSDGITVDTQLLQFKDANGSESHVLGQHGAYQDDSTVTDSYDLPGFEYGFGHEKSALDKYGNRTAIFLCKDGPIAIVMTIYTPGQFDRPAELAIVQRQVAALAV